MWNSNKSVAAEAAKKTTRNPKKFAFEQLWNSNFSMGGVVLAGSVGSNNLHRSLNFGTRSLFKTNLMFAIKLLIKFMHSLGVSVDLNFELDCCNLSCHWFEFSFICFTLANFRSAPPTSYVERTRFCWLICFIMNQWRYDFGTQCSYIFSWCPSCVDSNIGHEMIPIRIDVLRALILVATPAIQNPRALLELLVDKQLEIAFFVNAFSIAYVLHSAKSSLPNVIETYDLTYIAIHIWHM